MIRFLMLIILSFSAGSLAAQKYISEKSNITFYSEAIIEDITAVNKNSLAIIDLTSAKVAFSVPIIDFKFEKKLMQEHFNEKYMETEKYPKGTFQGEVKNMNIEAKGVQQVTATGQLTIHGVTKEVTLPGTIDLSTPDKIHIESTFTVKLEDYNIEIPQILWQNIAEQVEVKVNFTLKPKTE